MSDRNQAILYSGGHKGTEAEFGRCAEKWGVRQVTLSYDGHVMEYSKDVEVLSPAELLKGDVSMEIVSKRLGRTYTSIEQIRTVCQLIFHMVSRSYTVFVVGWIQGDDTVQGGTGLGRRARQVLQPAGQRLRPGAPRVVHLEGRSLDARHADHPRAAVRRHRHAEPQRRGPQGDRRAVRAVLRPREVESARHRRQPVSGSGRPWSRWRPASPAGRRCARSARDRGRAPATRRPRRSARSGRGRNRPGG